jgi:hypothetical protein
MPSEAGRRTRKKRNEQNLLRYVRVRYGRLPANAPPDALRNQAALLASRRRRNAPACFRKEGEGTVPNEEPKHASATPPVGAFGIGGRPKDWLVPVVLLSLREWNSYGYELMGRARMLGFGAMNPGTLYRTLRQMEKDGVVEVRWETSRGGRRDGCTPSRAPARHTWAPGPSLWSDTSRAWTTSSSSTGAGRHTRTTTKRTSRGPGGGGSGYLSPSSMHRTS